ncbi:MAG: recombinase family protein [Clostridia bacterium]|nr:recombinase family protein [Clostridia bacterium]
MNPAIVLKGSKNNLQIFDDYTSTYRVAAYCRVSTDLSDSTNSLQAQIAFFEEYFEEYPNWIKVGIFADEGISGTSLKKRDQFNQMIELARTGKIDIILTKEVSRFSRNVLDFLKILEDLKAKNVSIHFLAEGLRTDNPKDYNTLCDSVLKAQLESSRTSSRVQWGHERRMRKGVIFGRREMYGYNIVRDEDGNQHLEIIEEEAEIIRNIYTWFAAGDGTHTIARRLEQQGKKTKRYKNGWTPTVILRIVRNEKYVGDLLQGKTYTTDPLSHQKKYNRGERNKYYIRDHHPDEAIIDRELWDKVQRILEEKAPSDEMRAKHSNRYWVSGKIYCGLCGERYVSLRKKLKDSQYKAWNCFENNARGQYKKVVRDTGEVAYVGCNSLRVNDKVLKNAIYDIITEVIRPQKQKIIDAFRADLSKEHKPKDHQKKIIALKKEIKFLDDKIQDWFEKKEMSDNRDDAIRYQRLIDKQRVKLEELQKELYDLEIKGDAIDDATRYINTCIEELEKIVSLSDDEINEGLFERITKKIVVYPLKVIELHLSFLTSPIILQYDATGKGKYYKTTFTILSREEFDELMKNAPKNEIHAPTE